MTATGWTLHCLDNHGDVYHTIGPFDTRKQAEAYAHDDPDGYMTTTWFIAGTLPRFKRPDSEARA